MTPLGIIVSVLIAIYVTRAHYKVSTSDYQAQQQVKSDTAILLSSLRSIMHKGAYATSTRDSVDISSETKAISNFLTSPTGLAYYVWVDEQSSEADRIGKTDEPWRLFFLYLAELSIATDAHPAARRAADVELMFYDLREEDIRQVSSYSANLMDLIASMSKNRMGNPVIAAFVSQSSDAQEEQAHFLDKMQYLKELGINDPNIELFLAIGKEEGDDAVRAALDAGADKTITTGALLYKYREQLKMFPDN